MTMTKSRKAESPSTLPDLSGRWSERDIEFMNFEFMTDLRESVANLDNGQRLSGEVGYLAGKIQVIEAKHKAWMELAFERIAQLKEELSKASKASPLPYQGPWKQGKGYDAGQFVTYQGSIWHVNKQTLSRPGDDPDAFTLAVKRGADGKDAPA